MKLNIDKIKEVMEKKGISQEKLSKLVGCSFLKINYLLNERRDIYLHDAEKIATALELKDKDVILFEKTISK